MHLKNVSTRMVRFLHIAAQFIAESTEANRWLKQIQYNAIAAFYAF